MIYIYSFVNIYTFRFMTYSFARTVCTRRNGKFSIEQLSSNELLTSPRKGSLVGGISNVQVGEILSRWWFQVIFIFIPTWGDDPN